VAKANTSASTLYALKTEIFVKSIVGNNSVVNLDSKLRKRSNNVDTFTIQRFDNDGAIVSDAWMDLLKIRCGDEITIAGVLCLWLCLKPAGGANPIWLKPSA
jgi:hypothetical protein